MLYLALSTAFLIAGPTSLALPCPNADVAVGAVFVPGSVSPDWDSRDRGLGDRDRVAVYRDSAAPVHAAAASAGRSSG